MATDGDIGSLIQGIGRDAEAEIARIDAETERGLGERTAASVAEAARMRDNASKTAAVQKESILRTVRQALGVETRRVGLKARDGLLKEVLARVETDLAARMNAPGYRGILLDWVVEAAIGLAAPCAEVNASAAERAIMDKPFLDQAMRTVKELSGRDVELGLSAAPPLLLQGVVLSSGDGRTAYNNQVATRMQRLMTAMRKIINERLFSDAQT